MALQLHKLREKLKKIEAKAEQSQGSVVMANESDGVVFATAMPASAAQHAAYMQQQMHLQQMQQQQQMQQMQQQYALAAHSTWLEGPSLPGPMQRPAFATPSTTHEGWQTPPGRLTPLTVSPAAQPMHQSYLSHQLGPQMWPAPQQQLQQAQQAQQVLQAPPPRQPKLAQQPIEADYTGSMCAPGP